jgi:DNA-binding NtrC family response regulator
MFILIVEDEFFFANLIRTFLDKNGYKDLKHVDNALECLQQVREDRIPDIIILDYNLGNLDGVSTLKQIMAYKPDLKVILLSGQEDVEVAVQSIKKGAREYITKGEEGAFDKLLTVIQEIEAEMARKKAGKPVKKLFGKVKDFLMDND